MTLVILKIIDLLIKYIPTMYNYLKKKKSFIQRFINFVILSTSSIKTCKTKRKR